MSGRSFGRLLAVITLCLLATGLIGARRSGRVLVRSTTLGATIFIDGREVGQVPMSFPLSLRAGNHTIKVSMAGHADYLDTFRVKPGKEIVLEIDLLPVAGVVRVDAGPPGARLVVDGVDLGPLPFEGELEGGKHEIAVTAPGYLPDVRTVEIEAGGQWSMKPALVPRPAGSAGAAEATPWYGRWYVWAGAAVVVGGVAALIATSGGEVPPAPPNTVTLDTAR